MKLSKRTTIDSIGKIYIEILCIKLICADSDFFIWTKTDSDFSVFDFRMSCQVFNSCHDFSDT